MRNTSILTVAAFMVVAFAGMAHADDYRDVVRSTDGQVVHSSSGACVRTKWIANHDACGNCPPEAVEHTVIAREDRTVYFGFNDATLTEEGMERLNSLADRLNSAQDVKGARVVGYADRIGTSSYNDKLSKKRAQVVSDYLVAHGVVNSSVTKTRWVGKSEPTANCPKKASRAEQIECLQPDRRVEVEIVYQTEATTTTTKQTHHHKHKKQQ